MTDSTTISSTTLDRPAMLLLLAWVVAMAASLGAIFAGEVMGQTPCVLCWYQRAAMFPLAIILGVASYRGDTGVWRYALPVAGAGAVVAAVHSLLYFGILPEAIVPCGAGPSCVDANMDLLGMPLPVLAFAAFVAISVALLGLVGRKS